MRTAMIVVGLGCLAVSAVAFHDSDWVMGVGCFVTAVLLGICVVDDIRMDGGGR